MKLTVKTLSALAALSFTLAFCTGMSATLIYQEHKAIESFMATENSLILADIHANHSFY